MSEPPNNKLAFKPPAWAKVGTFTGHWYLHPPPAVRATQGARQRIGVSECVIHPGRGTEIGGGSFPSDMALPAKLSLWLVNPVTGGEEFFFVAAVTAERQLGFWLPTAESERDKWQM